MADRTTTHLLGRIIARIAQEPETDARAKLIEDVWRERLDFDFAPYQIDHRPALEVLVDLGLVHPNELER
jgi:hypothetical protein